MVIQHTARRVNITRLNTDDNRFALSSTNEKRMKVTVVDAMAMAKMIANRSNSVLAPIIVILLNGAIEATMTTNDDNRRFITDPIPLIDLD